MGLRTIHLKLNNPSKVKRAIIDRAFINYNNALNYLLEKAYCNIDEISYQYKSPKGNYSALTLSKWIDKALSHEINKFEVQPFKDSLKLDFGMTLANYFSQNMKHTGISFPLKNKYRPIYFCRYDTKRNFCLMYDAQNDKYFVKLYLMNVKNAKLRTSTSINRELVYISKNKEVVKSQKRETYIIVPLSFGKWQEKMLRIANDRPEIFRTAHLVMKNNDIYLSLSIDLPEENKIQTNTYLGLSRGIENPINFAIIDMKGNLIENYPIDYTDTSRAVDEKTEINIIVNKIVDIALKNKSMVILQNLTGKGDKLSWKESDIVIKPQFGCKKYNQLAKVLEYKLIQKGLPAPAKVSSVDIFNRCCSCGSNTKKNRFSKAMFICTTCGLSYNLDQLGSLNLALKLIKYDQTTVKLKARKTPTGMYLQNELLGLDFFVSKNENPCDKMKSEISILAERMEQNSSGINVLISKLINKNFYNIEII